MHWTFAINKDSYFEIRDNNEIKWNSALEVKKGEIICVYTGKPYSEIGFIFKAKTDLFEDEQIRKDWNKPAILVNSKIIIPNPISIKELRKNPILSQWGAVRRNFMGSHFKMPDEVWNELKKLILEKNSELKIQIEELEREDEAKSNNDYGKIDFYDLSAGRAHIVRDICYLISQNDNILENYIFDLLRENVKDDWYWKAYFQRSNKDNSPKYNLNAARTLKLIFRNKLELTDLGKELVNSITPEELFTYNYGIGVKKFFYKLALENYPIKTAMNILNEKGKLRFYAPLCDRTNKVVWNYKDVDDGFICEEDKHLECNDCDRNFLNHIKESSLPFETLKETKGEGEGFVFWMCSRVTPMHLTGSNPGYSGNYIYWDEEAEKELGDIEVLDSDNEIKTVLNSRIWKITPGEGHIRNILWDIFVKNEVIGIGWFGNERDYSDFETLEDIKKELFNFYNRSMDLSARMIWDFTNNIKIGDIIVANSGYKGVLGIGIVKSEYIGPKNPDNPAKNFIRSDFDYYVHFRKVNWLINDEIEFNSQIFDQKTLTPIYGDKWEKIKEAYIKKSGHYEEIFDKIENYTHNQIRPEEIIKKLFDDFNNEYLSTEIGQNHLKAYTETSERFRSTLNEVEIKKSRNEDANDDILYGLVPHKGRDIVGFMSDIKAFFEKSLEINPNKFPEIADALYELIEELNKNDDNSEKQKEVIDSFVENGYSKGIGAGTLSPTLFFINHKYPLINSKTKTTSEFLSKLIKKPVNLDTSLINYINNKKSLETLIGDLSDYVPYFENFAIFDIFCHWMCDKNLGNYAVDQDKYKEWYKNKFGGPVIDDTDLDNNTLALHPEELDINLKLNPRILDQVCGTLNAGKHIMLTGAPGTGKTDLAESVCDIASSLNFTDGYILTTATSDWTTFDTIGGYMPDETGKLYFEEGKFLQSIRENKWLIIDEINRADIDKAFGQLFTVLSGQGVELPYKNNGNSIKIRRGDKNKSYYSSEDSTYYVGKNWRILATMNVYDKDYLFEMSYAFMRRFTFIYIDLPDDSDFKELIESWCDGLESDYVDSVCNLLRINEYRQIGPAIFKDISEYIKERKKMGNTDYMLNDAVLSYILPQFEGLEKIKIVGIWKILQELFEENDELKIRLEEIATVKLDESK